MAMSMKNELITSRQRWFGELTLENLEAITKRVEEMLIGKWYTFVSNNELYGPLPRPEVRTSQKLSPQSTFSGKAVSTWYGDDKTYGGFHVNDTYGVWGCMTDNRPDRSPYLSFERNNLTIEHYAASGNKIIWVIATEDHDED